MYSKLSLWENKLEYLKGLTAQYKALDTSWWDINQWANYNNTLAKLENKIKDYTELIEFLKGANI